MEEYREKTPEQRISEKLFLSDAGNIKSIPKIKKRLPNSYKEDESTINNMYQSISEKTGQDQGQDNLRDYELDECGQKIDFMQLEIKEYKNLINLLRTEIAQYKNGKTTGMSDQITQYRREIRSLQSKLFELRCKIEAMQPEIMHYDKIILALKSEIAEYQREKSQITSEFVEYKKLIDSLQHEINAYKDKYGLISLTSQYGDTLKSLGIEIAKLKNKFDLMT
jgi:chromosome segregation ATPase